MLRIASDLIAEDNSLFKKGMNFPIIEKVYIQFHRPSLLKAQNEELTFSIDMFERLPTPWGLVRSGVVPDHPKIKTVSKVFKKIANEDGFRLFANVEMGKGVLLKEIR
jgi:ferredoxin--NADP+ reductase